MEVTESLKDKVIRHCSSLWCCNRQKKEKEFKSGKRAKVPEKVKKQVNPGDEKCPDCGSMLVQLKGLYVSSRWRKM